MDTPNSRYVFVIHGRNEEVRQSMFAFLRAIGLSPLEWLQAIEHTSKAAPYIGEVLDAAFRVANAVVALFTPDDLACLNPSLVRQGDPEHEKLPTGQARPNVIFETGMALGRHPNHTILVEIGNLRPFSDIAGRHVVRLNNDASKRNELALRLRACGCAVDLTGTDWLTVGDFSIPVASNSESKKSESARVDLLRDRPKARPIE